MFVLASERVSRLIWKWVDSAASIPGKGVAMRSRLLSAVGLGLFVLGGQCFASDLQFNLDSMQSHPYMNSASRGHASQAPESPKHFVPGYGYTPPGALRPDFRYHRLSPYWNRFQFGKRKLPYNLQQYSRTPVNNGTFPGPFYQPGFPYNRLLNTRIPTLYRPTF